ncbi:MAG: threonine/serine dehydratase [Ktedonobacteraceae bacterium]|nr:threonine/serine dehydratase [Ktedonobacteraceae bacterium]
MLQLTEIENAQKRLQGYVRRTPLVKVSPVKQKPGRADNLSLKLENLQITGSFKARGAVNKVLTLVPEQVERGIVTASGGNHGLGVAYAGWLMGSQATIYLPHNTPAVKAQKLEQWGAKVVFAGDVWDDANRAALAAAECSGMTYIHAFADEAVMAGQGTTGLEMLEDEPQLDAVLVAIGGGGLICGISTAIKAIRPQTLVIGIEPAGAPTLFESLKAGHIVELPEVRTAANTLAPRRSTERNLEIIQRCVDSIVLVTDDEMRDAARWLWFEMGIAAELSGAATLAPLLSGKLRFDPQQKVCALISGAGTDGLT